MQHDPALDALLDLHGSILDQGNGYWIKMQAWRVTASAQIPHGVRYSLTLHNPHGERILGYDNAHAFKSADKFRGSGRRLARDHRHRNSMDTGTAYEFKSAQQLLEDFFADVDHILAELGRP